MIYINVCTYCFYISCICSWCSDETQKSMTKYYYGCIVNSAKIKIINYGVNKHNNSKYYKLAYLLSLPEYDHSIGTLKKILIPVRLRSEV